MEEDKISNAKINYQMLQTLYDATDDEIKKICEIPNKKISEVCNSLENALEFFGVYLNNDDESKKDFYQKSLKIYPELLSDPAAREDLRDLKNSLVKKYKGAHLDVIGKFTFVLPDLYAFCQWLFIHEENPEGLLADKEVYCKLYENAKELDCLRSPHLYIEHAIRNNVCNKIHNEQKLSDWFQTDAIYTSTHDLISRILQFDVDGDRLLVVSQKLIIKMAKRVTADVNPLYYEMKKANAEKINYHNIYNGLQLAFTGGKIGGISNDITKIWNSPDVLNENTKQEAIDAVKWLCMETNFTIDYAKTLFKPTRPEYVDKILRAYAKKKVPYFFQFAKDKDYSDDIKDSQCEPINNSMINRIAEAIKNPKIIFKPIKKLEKLDYLMLLKDKQDNYFSEQINSIYDKWNRKYGHNVNFHEDDDTNKNNLYSISQEIKKELNIVESDDNKVINSLVSFLYKNKSSRKKKLLWYLYGQQLYENLCDNLKDIDTVNCKTCGKRVPKDKLRSGECITCSNIYKRIGNKIIICEDCGEEFEVSAKNNASTRCPDCYKKYRRIQKTETMRRLRQRQKEVEKVV